MHDLLALEKDSVTTSLIIWKIPSQYRKQKLDDFYLATLISVS